MKYRDAYFADLLYYTTIGVSLLYSLTLLDFIKAPMILWILWAMTYFFTIVHYFALKFVTDKYVHEAKEIFERIEDKVNTYIASKDLKEVMKEALEEVRA